jgi:uncharacterized RDD family membrane protein YckC
MRCERCGADMPAGARFCSACGNSLEVTETPDAPSPATVSSPLTTWPGADIGLPPHGPGSLADAGQRFLARLIDFLIFLPFYAGILIINFIDLDFDRITDQDFDVFSGPFDFFPFGPPFYWVVVAIYEVVLVALRGQTVGKMALGTKVVREGSNDTPGWGTSLLRWLSSAVIGAIPLIGLLDVLWLLWDKHRQCLHDKIAKTLVIRLR